MKHVVFSYKGQLYLIALDSVNCKSRKEIEVVAALCPLLKEIQFAVNQSPSTVDLLSPDQLRPLLLSPNSCWENVFTSFFIFLSLLTSYFWVTVLIVLHSFW